MAERLKQIIHAVTEECSAESYFVATVGGAPLAVIKQYMEQQKRV